MHVNDNLKLNSKLEIYYLEHWRKNKHGE
jgi:hypothetical protein